MTRTNQSTALFNKNECRTKTSFSQRLDMVQSSRFLTQIFYQLLDMSVLFSSQELRELVENVDFSEPMLEAETSLLPNVCGSEPKCEMTPYSLEDDNAILYHKFLEKGCKKCDTCLNMVTDILYQPVTFSVDYTRSIPVSLASVKDSIVNSLSDHFDKWCRQPIDDYEEELYENQQNYAKYNDHFEEEYWDWVHHEIDILKTWEEFAKPSWKRKRDSE